MLTPRHGRTDRPLNRPVNIAVLGSLCLFLSAVEYLIPKPLPFLRIGLANLPLLLALDILSPADFFLLALIKVLGQGILGGTLFSYVFLFSLAGTFASALLMYVLRGKKRMGFAAIGCAGAMVSNGIQLFLARYFIFGSALRYLAPPFLASGFITGIALGIICGHFCRYSLWYAKHTRYAEHTNGADFPEIPPRRDFLEILPRKQAQGKKENKRRLRRAQRWNDLFNADELFIAGLLMTLLFLFNRSPECRIVHFLFFCLLAWFSGKKSNVLATALIMAGIIFFNLLVPYGKTLAAVGPLRLTQGSLFAGLEKALSLTGLLMLSRACIKSDLRLPGALGAVLGESFRLLELMRERKNLIGRGNITGGIDKMLLELEADDVHETSPKIKPKRSLKGILLLCAMVLFTAAAVLKKK
jgi:heptaprenyl diphosphate synthase